MRNLVIGCVLFALAAAIINHETYGETLAARLGVAVLLALGMYLLAKEK